MTTEEKILFLRQIDEALDGIRPHLKVDGGDVEVVDITENMVVKVKWLGNCQNCFMSMMTMKAGVEEAIRSRFPQIRHVEAINGITLP